MFLPSDHIQTPFGGTFKYFESASEKFLELTQRLRSSETMGMRHSELENLITVDGRELLRRMFEEHLRLRGEGDVGTPVIGADGVVRSHKRLRKRVLTTVFGDVAVERIGYSCRGQDSLFPKDAGLNLPTDSYSHGMRKLVAREVAKSSFDDAVDSVFHITGVLIPKRTSEALAQKAAQDFESFYDAEASPEVVDKASDLPLLILTSDGKGIVMRQEDLTEETRRKAERSQQKLKKRRSKGEKANRKRMATVASVYAIDIHKRTAEDVLGEIHSQKNTKKPPKAVAKRVWASVEQSANDVLGSLLKEANLRDPHHEKKWVFLVDGCRHQLRRIRKHARNSDLELTIVLDIIHVIEYLWKAARALNPEASSQTEQWVTQRLRGILAGNANHVAAGMRRSATLRELPPSAREPVDRCAQYLLNNKKYLRYDKYLEDGLPIATGVIEGACRHLVKDRMDLTGARWSLVGAEAVLKLRSLKSSGDFERYWQHHENQEYFRNHHNLYVDPDHILAKIGQTGGEAQTHKSPPLQF